MRRGVTLGALAVIGSMLFGCGGSSPGHVSKADMGDEWPLTVDEGTLHCYHGAQVTITVGAKEYAVNGAARANKGTGVQDVDAIWADAGGGLKKNMGPLIQRGLKLCD